MRFFKYFCLALLFCAPARAEDTTLQEALDNIDDWLGVLRVIYTQGAGATAVESAGWTWLDPTEETSQSTFDFIDTEGPFLPGTNIVGATYNDGQWVREAYPFYAAAGWDEMSAPSAPVESTFYPIGEGSRSYTTVSPENTTYFSPSTGIFTAPVSGHYYISYKVEYVGVEADQNIWVGHVVGELEEGGAETATGTNRDMTPITGRTQTISSTLRYMSMGSITVPLEALSEVRLYFWRTASGEGTPTVASIRFSGFLIQEM